METLFLSFVLDTRDCATLKAGWEVACLLAVHCAHFDNFPCAAGEVLASLSVARDRKE